MKNNRLLLFLALAFTWNISAMAKTYPCHTWKTITVDCKVGYVDPEGKIMIEPKFDHAYNFSEGLAFVWSYENEEEARKNISLGNQYRDYEIGANSITGIIDSTGTYIVTPKLNFRKRTDFKNGIATVVINHDVRIINKKGEVIEFYDSRYDSEYRKILLKGRDTANHTAVYLDAYRHTAYGPFQAVEEFSENFGAVNLGGKWGYINRQGELVIPPQFRDAGYFTDGYAIAYDQYSSERKEHKTYYVIDTLGRIVIQSHDYPLSNFSEGMVAYSTVKDNKVVYGFMDATGKIVIEARYEAARGFHEGLASVTENGKAGYINKKGEWVVKPTYDFCGDFKYGTALFRDKKSNGYINTEGKVVWNSGSLKDCDDR